VVSRDMLLDYLVDYRHTIRDDMAGLTKKFSDEKYSDFLERSLLRRKGQISACDSLIDMIIQDKDMDIKDFVCSEVHIFEGISRFWWDIFQLYRFDR